MIPKESEQTTFLDVPLISQKTTSERLKKFSIQRWKSDGRRQVAADIVKNVKELFVGTDIDWESVLSRIHIDNVYSVHYGLPSIAQYDARHIGALVVRANWSMHDPPAVYLSVKCVAHRVSDKLEDLKSKMQEIAVVYGQKTLPDAALYMEILDFLLKSSDRKNKSLIRSLGVLLREGNIVGAHEILKKLR